MLASAEFQLICYSECVLILSYSVQLAPDISHYASQSINPPPCPYVPLTKVILITFHPFLEAR